MAVVVETLQSLWKTVRKGDVRIPQRVEIPAERTKGAGDLGPDFKPDTHYFQVRVNQMYLSYARKWFATYDPLVVVISEFTYDKSPTSLPFVVGPAMVDKVGQKTPTGMVFSDTRVAGPYPYRGDRLVLTVILSSVQRDDYARQVLKIVEGASGAIPLGSALTPYLNLGSVLLDGVETLFGLGNTVPIVGFRREFNPLQQPRYMALIDAPEESIDHDSLWVHNNELLIGSTRDTAKPFRDWDFVLFSIVSSTDRADDRMLPFYPLYEQAIKAAGVPVEADWQRAKPACWPCIRPSS
jgi:hypothetical protein